MIILKVLKASLLIPFFNFNIHHFTFYIFKNLIHFKGNGKLLLSGEYFVLDGASALAIPTQFGQSLHISENEWQQMVWQSFDEQENCWFEANFELPSLQILSCSDSKIAQTLQAILAEAKKENKHFLVDNQGLTCKTRLEFSRDWGLGSSSTLIYCIAEWARVNPYLLLEKTMGGSGYDLACAGIHQAIVYQRNGIFPNIQLVDFQPSFSENLYFVHLGKKQNSREGITRYRSATGDKTPLIAAINSLTKEMLGAKNLNDFEVLIQAHENLIANFLGLDIAKSLCFPDFWGQIKSLGAWGGDFILATSPKTMQETFDYFQKKGFLTIIPYGKMIKQ